MRRKLNCDIHCLPSEVSIFCLISTTIAYAEDVPRRNGQQESFQRSLETARVHEEKQIAGIASKSIKMLLSECKLSLFVFANKVSQKLDPTYMHRQSQTL